MKRILNTLAIAACLWISMGNPAAIHAQANKNSVPPHAKGNDPTDPWQRRIAKTSFDGLPLVEVVKILAQKDFFPEVNSVVPPELREVPVNVMELRSVTLEDIFTAIKIASDGQLVANVLNDRMFSFEVSKSPEPKRLYQAFS